MHYKHKMNNSDQIEQITVPFPAQIEQKLRAREVEPDELLDLLKATNRFKLKILKMIGGSNDDIEFAYQVAEMSSDYIKKAKSRIKSQLELENFAKCEKYCCEDVRRWQFVNEILIYFESGDKDIISKIIDMIQGQNLDLASAKIMLSDILEIKQNVQKYREHSAGYAGKQHIDRAIMTSIFEIGLVYNVGNDVNQFTKLSTRINPGTTNNWLKQISKIFKELSYTSNATGKYKHMLNGLCEIAKINSKAIDLVLKCMSSYGYDLAIFDKFILQITKDRNSLTEQTTGVLSIVFDKFKNQPNRREYNKIVAELLDEFTGDKLLEIGNIINDKNYHSPKQLADSIGNLKTYILNTSIADIKEARIVLKHAKLESIDSITMIDQAFNCLQKTTYEGFNCLLDKLGNNDEEKIKTICSKQIVISKVSGYWLSEFLIELNNKYDFYNDINTYTEAADLLINFDKRSDTAGKMQALTCNADQIVNFCNKSTEKLSYALEFLEKTDNFQIETLGRFITKYQELGKTEAFEYLDNLHTKAKELVSSHVPQSLRTHPDYQYLVQYVFPKGNSPNHTENLSCGDHLEHIKKYRFPENGYNTILTGSLGYKLKPNAVEDITILNKYTERINNVREFVRGRGPGDGELRNEFTEQVNSLFHERAWPEFEIIPKLSLEEKIICLLLGESERRKQVKVKSKPDPIICDLLIKYKYTFNENIEDYIVRNTNRLKEPNQITRNQLLLTDFSSIYGEDINHILRNQILDKLTSGVNKQQITEIYLKKQNTEIEDNDLTEKQWFRIKNTFGNNNIPINGQTTTQTGSHGKVQYKKGKYEILLEQLSDIFGNNLRFESEADRQKFYDNLEKIVSKLKKNLNIEQLNLILPELIRLRASRKLDIKMNLTELINYDANQIFAELNKYEEIIEYHKSAKKRNIVSYLTKTKETANARMGAHLCIANDRNMWENENYFEFVMMDKDTGKCVGVVMLLNIQTTNGKNYLWFGPNPFESFLDKVSSRSCYQYLLNITCDFAEKNDYNGVVVPIDEKVHVECTNRGGDFPGLITESKIKDQFGKKLNINFGREHTLSGKYVYGNGDLVWLNPNKII